MPTIEELGRLAREKYPGRFIKYNNKQLGLLIKENNPGEYDDYVDPDAKSKKGKKPDKKVGKKSSIISALETAEKAFNIAGNPTTRGLAIGTKALPVNEEIKGRLEEVRTKEGQAYGSDVAEAIFPKLFSPQVGDTPHQVIGKFAGRFATDVSTDPLSYIGLGMVTKLGRLAKIVHQTVQAGQSIKLNSKVAKDIAKVMGAAKPSAQVIKNFIKQNPPALTFSEELRTGQRALISAGNPVNPRDLAILTGRPAAAIAKPLSLLRRGNMGVKLEAGIRELLSTKTGNADFDRLLSETRDIVYDRARIKLEEGKLLNTKIENVSRELGIPRKELDKQIRNLVEAAKPSGKKIALKKYGSKQVVDDLVDSFNEKLVDAQVALKNASKLGDAKLVEQFSKDVVTYQGEINKLTGTYAPPPSISPKVDAIINEIRQGQHSQLMDEIASGVHVVPELADIEYLTHAMITNARKAYLDVLKKAGRNTKGFSTKELNESLANAMRRQFVEIKPFIIDAWKDAGIVSRQQAKVLKGKNGLEALDDLVEAGIISSDQLTDAVHTLRIDEVNKLAADGKLKNMFGDYTGEVFHTDPVYATTIRGMRGERARTAAEFYQEMIRRGLAIKESVAPDNWIVPSLKELKGYKVPQEVAKVLSKVEAFNSQPEVLNKFLRVYDKFHRLSKVWTLAVFPAYHTLNIVGNIWNNFLAGVTNPDLYRQAMFVQMPWKGRVRFTDATGKSWNSTSLARQMEKLGVVNKGWYAADHVKAIQDILKSGNYRDLITKPSGYFTLSTRNYFLRAGLKLGKMFENNARAAHFIDRLRKGDTAEQAALSVKKYLFDYGDLTELEQTVLNRNFFFYTWTRKNIPLQLQHLVTTPAKYGLPFKAKYEIEKTTDEPDERYLPEFVQENFPIRVGFDKKTNLPKYFMLGRWLPAADLLKLFRLHKVVASMAAPVQKEIIQQLWNHDLFFEREIEKIPGQKEHFLGKSIPKRLTHGGRLIRLLNEIDRLTKDDSDLATKIELLVAGRQYYTHDTSKSRMINKARVDEDMKKLRSVYYSELAKKPRDDKELARIKALILEKIKEY